MVLSESPPERNSRGECAESEALSYEGMNGLPWVIFQSLQLFVSGQGKTDGCITGSVGKGVFKSSSAPHLHQINIPLKFVITALKSTW